MKHIRHTAATLFRHSMFPDNDLTLCVSSQALVILIPLLGAPYLLTLMGPSRSESPGAYTVFQISRAIVLSSQVRPSSPSSGNRG